MKKLVSLLLVSVSLFCLFAVVPVYAEDEISVYVNRKALDADSPAISVNGRVLVPLRPICEALNCQVDWYQDTLTAEIKNEVTIVSMRIDKYKLKKIDRGNQENIQEVER